MPGQLAVAGTAGMDLLSGSLGRFHPVMPAYPSHLVFWARVLCGFLPHKGTSGFHPQNTLLLTVWQVGVDLEG